MKKVIPTVIIITVIIWLFYPLIADNKTVSCYEVTFINTTPRSMLGLVKFVVNEENVPINYKILNERWDSQVRKFLLLPGLYGVTKYLPKSGGVILDYRDFWVIDKPLKIIM
jgi:hypothetical protein